MQSKKSELLVAQMGICLTYVHALNACGRYLQSVGVIVAMKRSQWYAIFNYL